MARDGRGVPRRLGPGAALLLAGLQEGPAPADCRGKPAKSQLCELAAERLTRVRIARA